MMRWLRSACATLAHELGGADSPWQRVPMEVPPTAFGPGSAQPFAHYFEGQSGVPVTCLDEIVAWLATCEYVSDAEQFHQRDVWQEPCAFEGRRRGDCEDFALWTWRKLAEIGVDAEFYVGRVTDQAHPDLAYQHAWVVCRMQGEDLLFEPASRDPRRMLLPLAVVKDMYIPHFAVDRRFATSAFLGCLLERPVGAAIR